MTGMSVIERSRKGSGFDYGLGYDSDTLFQEECRLDRSSLLGGTTMLRVHLFAVVVLLMAVSGTAQLAVADETGTPPVRLSDDASWVRYHVKIRDYDGTELAKKVTISSVGRRTENGRQNRWLEFKEEDTDGQRSKQIEVIKVSIPERELLSAEKPLLHVVRFSYKTSIGKVNLVNELSDKDQNDRFNIHLGPYMLFFPGPLQQTRKLGETKTIDYQMGRLTCDVGVTGRHTSGYRSTTVEADVFWTTDYSLWLHKDVPFGFVAATMKTTKGVRDDKGTFLWGPQSKTSEYFLEDAGTGAKSSLQEND